MTSYIDIWLVDMAVDTGSPVLKVALSWVHRSPKPVDELWPTFGQHKILADVVRNPLNLTLTELVLGGLS